MTKGLNDCARSKGVRSERRGTIYQRTSTNGWKNSGSATKPRPRASSPALATSTTCAASSTTSRKARCDYGTSPRLTSIDSRATIVVSITWKVSAGGPAWVPSQNRGPARCKKCPVLRFGALPASRRNQRAGVRVVRIWVGCKSPQQPVQEFAPRLVQSSKTFARHYCFF